MYAIIKTGGKQYRVQKDDVLKVEKIDVEVGSKITVDEVIAVGGDNLVVGDPYVSGYQVTAEVLEQGKHDKVIIYKYKAKKDYRRKNGHRQPYTMIKITDIGAGKAVKKSSDSIKPKEEKVTKSAAPAASKEDAAPAKANMGMKKDELLAIAKDMGIEIPAKATKQDILDAIESK